MPLKYTLLEIINRIDINGINPFNTDFTNHIWLGSLRCNI